MSTNLQGRTPASLLAAVLALPAVAQPPPESAGAIMARVAENQERSQEMRRAFVYDQSVLIRFHRLGGRLAREEKSEHRVMPSAKGFEKKLVRFHGRYEHKGKLISYFGPHFTYKDLDLDGELISDLAGDLTGEQESRDGIAAELFPLTAQRQNGYEFRLVGREIHRGSQVHRISFRPLKPRDSLDKAPWAGEVLVDAAEYQPVLVWTKLARGIPFWVRTVLGTNLKQLGFTVSYKKFDHGIWFPVSYGGEFQVKALFFYKRNISISLANTGFRRAEVTSDVQYATSVAEQTRQ